MSRSQRRRLGGLAAMLGGLLFVASGVIFAVFTHGSTTADRKGTLLGLDGTDYCRLQVAWPMLLLAALAGARGAGLGPGERLGRAGFVAALTALTSLVLSNVLQCWVVDPDQDVAAVPVAAGFLLGLLAYLVFMGGLILYGLGVLRARAAPRWRALPLVLGLLGVPTLLAAVIIPALSPGGRGWDLAYAASRVPWGAAWVLLGGALWQGRESQAG